MTDSCTPNDHPLKARNQSSTVIKVTKKAIASSRVQAILTIFHERIPRYRECNTKIAILGGKVEIFHFFVYIPK
jgi:hypothetical protein